MSQELKSIHFCYNDPLTLIRNVRLLLLAEGIKIESLAIETRAVYEMLNSVEAIQMVSRPLAPEEPSTICGIPFRQVVKVGL
jgi:hypothetical protein